MTILVPEKNKNNKYKTLCHQHINNFLQSIASLIPILYSHLGIQQIFLCSIYFFLIWSYPKEEDPACVTIDNQGIQSIPFQKLSSLQSEQSKTLSQDTTAAGFRCFYKHTSYQEIMGLLKQDSLSMNNTTCTTSEFSQFGFGSGGQGLAAGSC